jgi:hypothetical protein
VKDATLLKYLVLLQSTRYMVLVIPGTCVAPLATAVERVLLSIEFTFGPLVKNLHRSRRG